MSILQFQNIRRAYVQGDDVLEDISFGLEPGEVVGLLGRNGAGKTTLLRIAMGMMRPQDGTVRVFGLDPRRDALEVKRQVGYVSEDQILPAYLRVSEVLDLHRGVFDDWDERIAADLLEQFEIPVGEKIKRLSKGQARQVALLCAVAHKPRLLLLDEPAGGLDPAARRDFLETSIRLLNREGTSILFSSHYMSDVERLADRIVMIHEGRVLLDSPLDDLRESYSLALVPHGEASRKERLKSLDSCLGVRQRADSIHAVFRLEPSRAALLLEDELGLGDTPCSRIGLEEMFVELAGGEMGNRSVP